MAKEVQLSENFWLNEFLESQTAKRDPEIGAAQFNPSHEIIENLRYLCEWTIQPLRTLLDTPMRISSGYRCEALNTAVKGSRSSQHIRGQAADIIMSDRFVRDSEYERERTVLDNMIYERIGLWPRKDVNANYYLFAAGCLFRTELDVDQIIHEYGEPGRPAWIHLSSSVSENRRHVLVLPRIAGRDTSIVEVDEALSLGC